MALYQDFHFVPLNNLPILIPKTHYSQLLQLYRHFEISVFLQLHSSLSEFLFLLLVLWGVQLISHVQLLATPWIVTPVDSSVNGIFQARILEGAAISYSQGWSSVLPYTL